MKLLSALVWIFASAPLFVFAQSTPKPTPTNPTPTPTPTNPTPTPTPTNPTPSTGGGLENPLNNIKSLPDLLNAILKAVVELGSIILVLAIVYVGFKFVVAQGNEEKLKDARGALVWTVIGGLILLGATAISAVIQETAGAL